MYYYFPMAICIFIGIALIVAFTVKEIEMDFPVYLLIAICFTFSFVPLLNWFVAGGFCIAILIRAIQDGVEEWKDVFYDIKDKFSR